MFISKLIRTRFPFAVIVLVVSGAFWAWNATHHDHAGPHGAPMTIAAIEQEFAGGGFTNEDGEDVSVTGATCDAGEDGKGSEPSTHFLCHVTFGNGDTDTVVVHVLQDELLFKSQKG